MTMLRAESLRLRQGNFLLRDVSLDCDQGQCLALLGHSGSGKTTCLEILAGLRRVDSGRVWIGGREATNVPPEQREVSYLPQDVALFPHLSVRENILFPARMRRLAPDGHRLRRLCEMLEIVPLLDRPDVRSLSGGEAQRVAIARALIVPPRVLFLDECFGALDAPRRRRLARQFRDLRQMTGTTTVMVSHDAEDAFLMADRLAVLHQGSLQQIGEPGELLRQPATVEVAELLGMQNILPLRSCQPGDGHWRCDLGNFELLVPLTPNRFAAPSHVGFFSWDVSPAAAGNFGEQQSNRLRLRVVDSERRGHEVRLRLRTDQPPSLVIEASWHESLGPAAARGDWVEVQVPLAKIHAWPATSDGLEKT